jgi:hypothetical protein
MVGCKLMCTFCPQDVLRKNYGERSQEKYMSLETFKTALSKVPLNVRIDFSGMAEPWLNSQCTEMLEISLQKGHRVAIYTTLFGISPLEAERIIKLLRNYSSQVEVVCLHLPDAGGNMRGWQYTEEWEQVFRMFESFAWERKIGRFEVMTMDSQGRLHPSLDHFKFVTSGWVGHDRAGSLKVTHPGSLPQIKTAKHNCVVSCIVPHYDSNVLLPNGDVALCGMDYGLTTILGNLLTMEYYDLFNSESLSRLKIENMKPSYSTKSICKNCSYAVKHHWVFDGFKSEQPQL